MALESVGSRGTLTRGDLESEREPVTPPPEPEKKPYEPVAGTSAYELPPSPPPVVLTPPASPSLPPAGATAGASGTKNGKAAIGPVTFSAGVTLSATAKAGDITPEPGMGPNGEPGRAVTLTVTGQYSLTTDAKAQLGPVTGKAGWATGSTSTWQVRVSEADYRAMAAGKSPVPNPMDPRTLPPGGALTMITEKFWTTEAELKLRGTYVDITGKSAVTQSSGTAVAIVRGKGQEQNKVKIYLGPTNAIANEFSLGVGRFGVSATAGVKETLRDSSLAVVELDLSTPEGQQAYNDFVQKGQWPSGPGVRTGRVEQTDYSKDAYAKLELDLKDKGIAIDPKFSAGLSTSSSQSLRTTRWDNPPETITELKTEYLGRKTLWTQTKDAAGRTRTTFSSADDVYSREPAEVLSLLFRNSQPVPAGSNFTTQVTLTGEESDALRTLAQQYVKDRRPAEGSFIDLLAKAKDSVEVARLFQTYGGGAHQYYAQLNLLAQYGKQTGKLPDGKLPGSFSSTATR